MTYRFASVADVETHLARHTDYETMARFAYHERAFNLDRTRRLLAALGDPHRDIPVVHVAGTKGKGSVSHMTSACLGAAGIRAGLFTSPHLVSPLERIRIANRPVDEPSFCRGMERVAAAADATIRHGEEAPTFFERIFALAALLFAEGGVETAVYEVGLGGRLDATNVLSPSVCAITTLALDHTAVLGNTLAEIASEKAGILKPGVPAVVAPNPPDAMEVVVRVAAEQGAPLILVGRDLRHRERVRGDGRPGIVVDVDTPSNAYTGLALPLLGLHQGANTAVAVGILEVLRHAGQARLGEDAVRRGLAAVRVAGRLQILQPTPPVILDVAHNEVSIRASVTALAQAFPGRPFRVVAGFSKDKDWRAALAPLAGVSSALFATSAGGPRAADPREIAAFARCCGRWEVAVRDDVPAAVQALFDTLDPGELGLITGSFFVAGQALKTLGLEAD